MGLLTEEAAMAAALARAVAMDAAWAPLRRLEGMSLRALQKEAEDTGVSEADEKAALLKLILSARAAAPPECDRNTHPQAAVGANKSAAPVTGPDAAMARLRAFARVCARLRMCAVRVCERVRG